MAKMNWDRARRQDRVRQGGGVPWWKAIGRSEALHDDTSPKRSASGRVSAKSAAWKGTRRDPRVQLAIEAGLFRGSLEDLPISDYEAQAAISRLKRGLPARLTIELHPPKRR